MPIDNNEVKRLGFICDDPSTPTLVRVDAWCQIAALFDEEADRTYPAPYMKEKVRSCIDSIRRLVEKEVSRLR